MKNILLSLITGTGKRKGIIKKIVITTFLTTTLLLGGVSHTSTVSAAATLFFVAPNGSDNTASGSSTTPFKTINYALKRVTPGTTVIVREGTYKEKVQTVLSGTSTSPITIQAQGKVALAGTSDGKILKIEHSYYIIQGFDFDGSVYQKDELMELDEGSFNIIQNNTFRNASDECITIEDYSKGNQILNNQFVNCNGKTNPVVIVKDAAVQGTTCGNRDEKGLLLSATLFSNINLKNPSCTTPTKTTTPAPTVAPIATKAPTATPTRVVSPTITKVPTTAPTKTVAPSPTRVPTVVPTTGLFSLKNWKLTLPIGSSGNPTEIKQPELSNGYRIDPYFITAPSGNGYRFRAPVNGVTTSGSSYPRSELRELTSTGSNASWSSGSGTHTMILDQAITAVPLVKKHVVAGQIHDGGDDVIVIRLEDKKLFIDVNGADGPTLNANYVLGTRFTVKFQVSGNQTRIYYNNSTTPAYTLNQSYSGAYFKAGAYTQSNCERETTCSSSNYGEVIIYNATVTHQ